MRDLRDDNERQHSHRQHRSPNTLLSGSESKAERSEVAVEMGSFPRGSRVRSFLIKIR